MSYSISDIAIAGARKLTQLDFVANNLANTATTGFKSEHLYYAMKGKQAQENARQDLGPTVTGLDFAQGTLQITGNPLDVAIEGDGYFTIQGKNSTGYTRNGSFVLNNKNELVTQNGDYVLGENSRPIVINGKKVQIDNDGTIHVDDAIAGKLKIAAFNNPRELNRTADSKFLDNGKAGLKKADKYRISGSYLEMSNVNSVKEMVEMMDIQRTFETYQKIILTMADFDKLSTNRIGKLF